MALPNTLPSFTFAEYLAFERESPQRHEYLDGLIYAMAGASPEHCTISINVSEIVTRQIRGTRCRPFSSDMKTRCIPLTPRSQKRGLFAYPDFLVVCGEPIYHDQQHDVLINPKLIVEVLSPTTEGYDRGEKFRRYRELASLTDYLLVAQDQPRIEHFVKQADGGSSTVITDPAASVFIASINCLISLAEVYEWSNFPTPAGD